MSFVLSRASGNSTLLSVYSTVWGGGEVKTLYAGFFMYMGIGDQIRFYIYKWSFYGMRLAIVQYV